MLDGHVALVTGGAKRVGRAIVLELAEAGCDVAIHYNRSRAEAESVAAQVSHLGRRVATIAADLGDPSSWHRVIQQTLAAFDRLDILVNNASLFLSDRPCTIEAFDRRQWETVLRVNLVAPMALCHHAAPHLAARGRGRVVNLCDIMADRPRPAHLAYSASKAAMSAMTRALARALAPEVLVNGVAPGIAAFPDVYPKELREKLVSQVPLRREGTPQEVARLVRFLVEGGDYLTGQIIPIDGGRSLV